MTNTECKHQQDIHDYFGLSYANYMVIPRTLLQSMPADWQGQFMRLIDQLESAFQHIEAPEAYKVNAATERVVRDMAEMELKMAQITVDWYRGETPPKELSAQELAEWKDQYATDEPVYYTADGQELDPDARVLIPTIDPVPHYNHGRTRVEPQFGEREQS